MVEPIDMFQKYRSRKWQLTLLVLGIAVAFSAFSTLTSELASVMTGLGVSYNTFQGIVDWQKARSNG